MSFEDIYKIVDGIPGWMGRDDCRVLHKYAQEVKGLIVEIGCYKGRSARTLALSSPDSLVITIDSFKLEKSIDEALENIKDLNIRLMVGKSEDIGRTWDTPIDLLFVDGGHTYSQVKKDIQLFAKHVKHGGYVLLHDFTSMPQKKYGVNRAVREMQKKYFSSCELECGIAVCKRV